MNITISCAPVWARGCALLGFSSGVLLGTLSCNCPLILHSSIEIKTPLNCFRSGRYYLCRVEQSVPFLLKDFKLTISHAWHRMRLVTLCCLGVSVLQKPQLCFLVCCWTYQVRLDWKGFCFVLNMAGRERTSECPCPQLCWFVLSVPEEGLGS